MRINNNGFGSGEEATTGEFLSEGRDYWVLTYTVNGEDKVLWAIDNYHKNDGDIQEIFDSAGYNLEDESVTANGKLGAKFTGKSKDGVKIEITYSFGVNDKFFVTDVKVTNDTGYDLSNVKFTKLTNIQQDYLINYHVDTYNKVIANPIISEEGGEENYAMVVARGPVTNDGFSIVSFDKNAKATYLKEGLDPTPDDPDFTDFDYIDSLWRNNPLAPTKGSNEDMSIFYNGNGENSHYLYDSFIVLSTKLGEIVNGYVIGDGESASTKYYTSLDNEVHTGLQDIMEAAIDEFKTRTDKKIEMKETTNYEYSIDGGTTWSATGVFDNLSANTLYTIQKRNKSNTTDVRTIKTRTKASGKTPTATLQAVVVSENSITVKADRGYEYSIDGGSTWQTDETFNGLDSDKEYSIITRVSGTYSEMPGSKSAAIKVKTQPKLETALDDTNKVEMDVKIVDVVPTIIFNKGILYEAVKDATAYYVVKNKKGEIVEEKTTPLTELADKNIKIVFDVVSIIPTASDEKHYDGKTFGFTFDVEIKVYYEVDGDMVYVGTVNNLSKPIPVIVKVPENLKKEGRKFYIARKHGNDDATAEWTLLSDEDADEDTIMFMNDKFSEFFVVYEDTNTTNNPKTGDNILTYVVMLIITSVGLYLVKTKRFE